MADPVITPLIIIGMAAAQSGMSFMQAREQQKFAKATRKAETRAARTQATQVYRSAQLEKQKTIDRHHLIESRIRVAAGESGLGLGGSYLALERQADIDAGRDVDIIMANAEMGARNVMSQVSAKAPTINPVVAGMFGALQGAQTGLSIVGSGQSLKAGAAPAPKG